MASTLSPVPVLHPGTVKTLLFCTVDRRHWGQNSVSDVKALNSDDHDDLHDARAHDHGDHGDDRDDYDDADGGNRNHHVRRSPRHGKCDGKKKNDPRCDANESLWSTAFEEARSNEIQQVMMMD